MDLKNVYLTTFIPEFPEIYNYNNQVFKRYLDVIYDETNGVVIVPVNTPGRVKAATGEFVTTITDTLVVKKQFTNMYENYTTVDTDYYYAYIGDDASVRDASTWENSRFKYVDVISPYYKINNEVSTGFKCSNLGQEIQLLFDLDSSITAPYHILIDPSINETYKMLSVNFSDASAAWIKLIAVNYDASWGTTWAVKEYGGTYHLI